MTPGSIIGWSMNITKEFSFMHEDEWMNGTHEWKYGQISAY